LEQTKSFPPDQIINLIDYFSAGAAQKDGIIMLAVKRARK
jgi:hypothetical protein